MSERMTDERLSEINSQDLRTHTDPDLDDLVDELLQALKADRGRIEELKNLLERWCEYYVDGMSGNDIQELYVDTLHTQEKGSDK